MRVQAEAEYPAECCGVVLARASDPRRPPLHRLPEHPGRAARARTRSRYPRDSRTAYYIDPKDLLAIGRPRGRGLPGRHHLPLPHRHRRVLLRDGHAGTPSSTASPPYPDAAYVVVSVVEGEARGDRPPSGWDARQRRVRPRDVGRCATPPERLRGRHAPTPSRSSRSAQEHDARRRQQPGARLPRRRRHAVLRRARRGRAPDRRGRAHVRRLPGLVGPARSWATPRPRWSRRSQEAVRRGTSYGAPTGGRGGDGRADPRGRCPRWRCCGWSPRGRRRP